MGLLNQAQQADFLRAYLKFWLFEIAGNFDDWEKFYF